VTYSSSLALGRRQYAPQRNKNAISFRDNSRTLGPVSNTVILIVLACVLGLLYLTQVTKTNAFGYRINDLQKQQSSLKQEHDDLEIASARLQALDRVKSSEVNKNLVSVAPKSIVQD
jgi:Tfp pilus assembly protein PilN